VDEASEAIVAHQLPVSKRRHLGGRAGQLLLKPLMRSSEMVVLEKRGQYPLQMSSAEDQEVIQALRRSVRHVRAVLAKFVTYYNQDRPHRSLSQETPAPSPRQGTGKVVSRPVLNGLHHVYERAA